MRIFSSLAFFGAFLWGCMLMLPNKQAAAQANSGNQCSHSVLQTLSSTDKQWTAELSQDGCAGDYAFESWEGVTVTLFPSNHPADREKIFTIEGTWIPAISWLGKDALQITTLQSPYIDIQKKVSKGIKIMYVYKPMPQ